MITTINEFKKFLNENNSDDKYSEVYFKMDKFLPDDQELQEEYYDIIDSQISYEEKIQELATFLNEYIDEETFSSYMNDEEFSFSEFAKYIIDRDAVDPYPEYNESLNIDDEDDVNLSKELKDKLYIGDFH